MKRIIKEQLQTLEDCISKIRKEIKPYCYTIPTNIEWSKTQTDGELVWYNQSSTCAILNNT